MNHPTDDLYAALASTLHIDCAACSGLCCVALFYAKSDGFPADKPAETPCSHLLPDFRCAIHAALPAKRLKGCLSYDCFGAGQRATRLCGSGGNWSADSAQAHTVFEVFLTLFTLHQLLWYLLEAASVDPAPPLRATIDALILENRQLTSQEVPVLAHLNLESYGAAAGRVLREIGSATAVPSPEKSRCRDHCGKNFRHSTLDGRDFSMSLLLAANFEGCLLRRTNFLGADLRDANIKNADLSESIFLTQMQINSARGNAGTILPARLSRPDFWSE